MKKSLILLLNLFLTFPVFAQESLDPEMQHLMEIVASLRQTERPEEAWNQANEDFGNDTRWTIMDEITPHENECLLSDRKVKWFALNRILSQRMGYEDNKTRGDFNNGEDPNFNYSLIERSVKAGRKVEYELSSREGEQIFIIMPSNTEKAKFEISLYRGKDKLAQGKTLNSGDIYMKIDAKKEITADDVLRLVVINNSNENMAFVIINHNTRKK